jgi:hypothetical protein
VTVPTVTGLAHGTDEAHLAPVRPFDDPGLAVDEAADAVRRDPDHLSALGEEGVEALLTLPVQQGFGLDGALVPAQEHARLAQMGNLQVLVREVHVAHDTHVRDRLQALVGDLEQRAGEVAGDAPVAARALELLGQKALVKPMGARGQAPDHITFEVGGYPRKRAAGRLRRHGARRLAVVPRSARRAQPAQQEGPGNRLSLGW